MSVDKTQFERLTIGRKWITLKLNKSWFTQRRFSLPMKTNGDFLERYNAVEVMLTYWCGQVVNTIHQLHTMLD